MALRELLENSRAVTTAPCAAAPASSTRRAEDLVFLNNRLNAASDAGLRAGQRKPCDTRASSLLRPLEISQVGWRLVFARRHQEAVAADEIILSSDANMHVAVAGI